MATGSQLVIQGQREMEEHSPSQLSQSVWYAVPSWVSLQCHLTHINVALYLFISQLLNNHQEPRSYLTKLFLLSMEIQIFLLVIPHRDHFIQHLFVLDSTYFLCREMVSSISYSKNLAIVQNLGHTLGYTQPQIICAITQT